MGMERMAAAAVAVSANRCKISARSVSEIRSSGGGGSVEGGAWANGPACAMPGAAANGESIGGVAGKGAAAAATWAYKNGLAWPGA